MSFLQVQIAYLSSKYCVVLSEIPNQVIMSCWRKIQLFSRCTSSIPWRERPRFSQAEDVKRNIRGLWFESRQWGSATTKQKHPEWNRFLQNCSSCWKTLAVSSKQPCVDSGQSLWPGRQVTSSLFPQNRPRVYARVVESVEPPPLTISQTRVEQCDLYPGSGMLALWTAESLDYQVKSWFERSESDVFPVNGALYQKCPLSVAAFVILRGHRVQ